jgi:hypothetical protein
MPVFYRDNLKVLYIHVPKTGGTAIELFFSDNGFSTAYLDRGQSLSTLNPVRCSSPQHMEAAILSKLFKLSSFDYVFMTVRDPIARILSEYKVHIIHLQHNIPDVNAWVRDSLIRYNDDPYMFDNHIRPQTEFWLPGADVFKQEDGFGPGWVEAISRRIAYEFRNRTVEIAMKFAGPDAARENLTEESIASLRRFYRLDYAMFGYPEPVLSTEHTYSESGLCA